MTGGAYTCMPYCQKIPYTCTVKAQYYYVLILSTDAPFQAKYVLHALQPLPHSSPAYTMLKLTEQAEFEEHLRKHPNAFSWKTVAEVLYRCGEEKHLDTLSTYMKSPEGKYTLDLQTAYMCIESLKNTNLFVHSFLHRHIFFPFQI